MTRSLIALWTTLIAAILTISVLAEFWILQREQGTRERVREILASRLAPFNDSIQRVFDDHLLSLRRDLESCDLGRPADCVEFTRSPLVETLVVVNSDAQLLFPSDLSAATRDRQSLVNEAYQLLREMSDPRPSARLAQSSNSASQSGDNGQRLYDVRSYAEPTQSSAPASEFSQALNVPPELSSGQRSVDAVRSTEDVNVPAAEVEDLPPTRDGSGWISWYHRRGMVLGLWWNQQDRRAIVTLPRARWMADIVAVLPDAATPGTSDRSTSDQQPKGTLNQLVDVEGNLIYQWGNLPQGMWTGIQTKEPDAVLAVTAPLDGWRLRTFASTQTLQGLAGDTIVLPLWLAVVGISAALVLGGVMATVSLNRQLRLAAKRVSFVNQVSHELRTPLTNIRMYADLLAASLETDDAEDPSDMQRVAVIQNESQRLSRLITNVLHFARADTQPAKIVPRPAVLDEVVRDVLEMFRPRLDGLQLELHTQLACPEQRQFDPDVVEQILVNLIGNAEKYAAHGKRLDVETRSMGEHIEVIVRDFGPGVPKRLSERIFQPFFRGSDRLEDPAGTGIGLTIVRNLARGHGGDCQLEETQSGAAFHFSLLAPIIPAA